MGLIKILAKTYGNYFLTMQGVKVMKTIKKDDHVVLVWENFLLQTS